MRSEFELADNMDLASIILAYNNGQINISNYSESEIIIINCLINGRNEKDINIAKKYFNKASSKSEAIFKESNLAYSLYIESICELANIEYDYQKRIILWEKFIKTIIVLLNQYSENEDLILHCSDSFINYIQEQYVSKDIQLLKILFNILIGKIDNLIDFKKITNCSHLLVKKAAILRNFSNYQVTQLSRQKMLEQAHRCIDKSMSIDIPTWYSLLEKGKYFLYSSIFEKKIETYNEKILQAESLFIQSQDLKCTIHNTLALCDLYNITYQTAPFLSMFKIYEEIETNRRRFLYNSYYLAESTIKMFYSHYPDTIISDYLSKSDILLNEAILAGYSDSRIITDLAFIKAAKGEISVAAHILKTLKTGSTSYFDWNDIVEEIKQFKDSNDLFIKGFALGIDEAGIWNKLGTFAVDFLNDIDLGLKMYKFALKLNSSNPIVLTNIARTLLKTTLDETTLSDAEHYITQASNFSTFRFQWWRQVRSEVDNAKNKITKLKPYKSSINIENSNKISELYKFYLKLKEMENTNNRGYEFEKLIKRYIEISLGNARKSYVIKSKPNQQIDAAFFYDKDFYRVETKWCKEITDHNDIASFYF